MSAIEHTLKQHFESQLASVNILNLFATVVADTRHFEHVYLNIVPRHIQQTVLTSRSCTRISIERVNTASFATHAVNGTMVVHALKENQLK